MIVGIGTDIIEIDRVLKAAQKDKFIDKYFTTREKELFVKKKKSIAGNFAVKESVSKMFGTGIRKFTLKDIEVLRDDLGKPYVNLYNEAKKLAIDMKIDVVHVTISDTENYAIAYVIGESVGMDK